MDSVKEWVINKCKLVINDDELSPGYTNVVTPNNIPAFTIPRTCSLEQQHRSSKELKTDLGENCSINSSTSGSLSSCSPCRSPTSYTPPNNDFLLLPSSLKHPRSAPVSPSHSPTLKFGDEQSVSTDDVSFDNTNADPQSLAAMGLAHFKTKTPFGFDTLKQAPHTRRKESLFHYLEPSETGVHNSVSTLQVGRRNFSSCDTVRIGLSIPSYPEQAEIEMDRPILQRVPSSRRRNIQSLVSPLAMLTTPVVTSASVDLSPGGGSPSHGLPWSTSSSPVSTPDAGTKIRLNFEGLIRRASSRGQGEPKMRNSIYRRRRSSLPGLNENNNVAKTYGFRVHGRSVSECVNENSQFSINGTEARTSLSANSTELTLNGSQNSLSTSCSCHSVKAVNPLAEFGELKFSVRYVPEKRHVRVLLIRAEHLVLNERNEQNTNPFAKVCLMPGKLQKQSSNVAKHTTDPIFNEEFHFHDIDADQLRSLRLRIKIQNKVGNLRRPELIGEVIVGLGEFDLLEEQRMWKKLERKNESDELGFMQLRLCFEPKDARLSITIGEITNLPKHKIHGGAADAYVKIELIQQGRNVEKTKKQQTSIKKKTLNPAFNQTFTFDVSPRIEDLNYTSIVLTVCNHERLRHDEVIGQVKLGLGATEETELQHWGLVIQNPEQEFTEVHWIMEPDGE
ncbi:uncharacterized protein LOC141905498 [Tubulanus polymorphus]|uniref:uncharacterized protein LOC141905498 n=1 Tax=Tubulanus polymorphus TaxID=672921 RepID=UPI003DA367D8